MLSQSLHAGVLVENKKVCPCLRMEWVELFTSVEPCVFRTWVAAGVCGDLTGGEYCLGAGLLNIQKVGLTLTARLKEKKKPFLFLFLFFVCVRACVCACMRVCVQKLCGSEKEEF